LQPLPEWCEVVWVFWTRSIVNLTLQEIAVDHGVHPIQVSQWKKQLLEGASEFPHRRKSLTPLRQRCNGLGGETGIDG
jgi:hypothetical protein